MTNRILLAACWGFVFLYALSPWLPLYVVVGDTWIPVAQLVRPVAAVVEPISKTAREAVQQVVHRVTSRDLPDFAAAFATALLGCALWSVLIRLARWIAEDLRQPGPAKQIQSTAVMRIGASGGGQRTRALASLSLTPSYGAEVRRTTTMLAADSEGRILIARRSETLRISEGSRRG